MGQYTAWANGVFKEINNKENKRLISDSENKECFVPLIHFFQLQYIAVNIMI